MKAPDAKKVQVFTNYGLGPRGHWDMKKGDDGLYTLTVKLPAGKYEYKVPLTIAREGKVPPYVIFHDATLREMARMRPSSIASLLTVKGVGARKADDLGEIFLGAIREYRAG